MFGFLNTFRHQPASASAAVPPAQPPLPPPAAPPVLTDDILFLGADFLRADPTGGGGGGGHCYPQQPAGLFARTLGAMKCRTAAGARPWCWGGGTLATPLQAPTRRRSDKLMHNTTFHASRVKRPCHQDHGEGQLAPHPAAGRRLALLSLSRPCSILMSIGSRVQY